MKNRPERALAAMLVLIFAGLVLAGLRKQSPTVDEFAHLPAGYSYWRTGDFSLYNRNPPLVKLIASLPWLALRPKEPLTESECKPGWRPWCYAAGMMSANAEQYPRLVFWGRVPIVVLAVLLGLAVWRVSRGWYGPAGGLLSLAVFCWWPDVLAHAGLATVDMGAAFFIFVAAWAGLHFWARPGFQAAVRLGVCLGLSLLAKFTALFLVPWTAALVFLARKRARPDGSGVGKLSWPRVGFYLLALAFSAWLTLAAGYRFKFAPRAAAQLTPVSRAFALAPGLFRSLFWILPSDYVDGLDLQLRDSEVEVGEFPNYLFGQWYRGQKWYYFPVALAVKTPLPILLGFVLALALTPRGRRENRRRSRFQPAELLLLALMIWLYFGITARNHLQIGIRYLLPLFPFAAVLLGRLADFRGRAFRWFLAALGLWLALGTLRVCPHFLAYFNELAGGPDRGYKILLDSNLDWGQDLPGLADYLKQHGIDRVQLAYFGHADPAVYGIRYEFFQGPGRPGLTAISANYLMGFPYPITYTRPWSRIPPESTAAYRGREPLAKIGYSIFLFRD